MTVKITLACTECKQRNYNTTKNKKNNITDWHIKLIHWVLHNFECTCKQRSDFI